MSDGMSQFNAHNVLFTLKNCFSILKLTLISWSYLATHNSHRMNTTTLIDLINRLLHHMLAKVGSSDPAFTVAVLEWEKRTGYELMQFIIELKKWDEPL